MSIQLPCTISSGEPSDGPLGKGVLPLTMRVPTMSLLRTWISQLRHGASRSCHVISVALDEQLWRALTWPTGRRNSAPDHACVQLLILHDTG